MSGTSKLVRAHERLECYWLTRDSRGGELVDAVEVWAVCPERHRSEHGDVVWLAPMDYLVGIAMGQTHVDDWTLDEARREIGNGIPLTDRECVRVGDPRPSEAS